MSEVSDRMDAGFEAFMKKHGEKLLACLVNGELFTYGNLRELMNTAFHGGASWGGSDFADEMLEGLKRERKA